MLDETIINKAYQLLEVTRQMLFDVHNKLIEAQRLLTKKKTELIMSGVIDGKNEEMRKSQIISMSEVETSDVLILEKELDVAQLNNEFANYEVNRINTLIKWLK
jgi:hypothetical protein